MVDEGLEVDIMRRLTEPAVDGSWLAQDDPSRWTSSFEGSRVFEIGGADQVSYGDLKGEYARQRGLRRRMIRVPFLTPRLSSLSPGLVTFVRVESSRIDAGPSSEAMPPRPSLVGRRRAWRWPRIHG